jgi:hypothetical protein
MSEPTVLAAGDLDGDLRRYFAMTTSTELPRRVTEMSARTLRARRVSVTSLLAAGAGGVLATAALVVLIATHAGVQGGVTSGTSTALQKGAGAPAVAAPLAPALISYAGVDTSRLARSGTLLLPPAGHGTALLSSAQARVAAATALGAKAGAPGAAVLAFAELVERPQPTTCLCWVVDIPIRGGVVEGAVASPPLRTELVLVDALNGRIVTALSGSGIP